MRILLLRKFFVLKENAEVLIYDYTLTAVKYVQYKTVWRKLKKKKGS